MKKNEIKRTIEQVVRTEYITDDGTIFYDEAEARKYEESALFTVNKQLKRLNRKQVSVDNLFGMNGCEEFLEIFDIQDAKDLENLKRYIYLKLSYNGASEKTIKSCFTAENENRTNYVIDNITFGHEVLIFWGYDEDWVWTYKNGSLEGYFEWIKEQYNKIIAPEKELGE